MENFESMNREEDVSDLNKEYAPSPGTIVMFTEASVLPQLPTHYDTPKTKTTPKPKSTAHKAIILAKGTISVLAYLSVFACLVLLLLTYQNQQDILQQLQRSQVVGAANPSLASAPLSYITVGGCTQVQLTLSQYSGGFVMQACWGSSCGEPAIGNCQPQVMQQAIANFEATNPTCLGTTTAPAPATSSPVPTTSSQSNYYITIGGCTQVSVFQWSGSGQNYVTLSWNGYGSSAYGATVAVALQQATAEFEAQNPPCLIGTTTAPSVQCPAYVPPVTTAITQSFNGALTSYDWTISPTVKSSACSASAYIIQYAAGASCVSAANVQTTSPVVQGNACVYSFSDGDSRLMTLSLSCDSSASEMSLASTVPVTMASPGRYRYAFTGRYAGVCGTLPSTEVAEQE